MNDIEYTTIEKMLTEQSYPKNEQHKEQLRNLLFAKNYFGNKEKVEKLFEDAGFMKELVEADDIMKVRELFLKRDVELSIYELKKLGKVIRTEVNRFSLTSSDRSHSEELDMDDLEDVAGGRGKPEMMPVIPEKQLRDTLNKIPKEIIERSWIC